MSDQNTFWALALVGSVVLPCGYVALCVWMMRRRAWWLVPIDACDAPSASTA